MATSITSGEFFVVEISTIKASDLSTATIYASDGGFVDNSVPRAYPPYISSAFQITRSIRLDPSDSAFGASWGTCSLANVNRQYDVWAQSYSVAGQPVVIKYGRKTFDATRGIWTDPTYASLVAVYNGIAAGWTLTEVSLDIDLRDCSFLLENIPIQQRLFAGTDGDGTHTGQRKPYCRAQSVNNVSPLLIDAARLIYQYNDFSGTLAISNIFEDGAAVFGSSGDVTDLTVGTTPAGNARTANVNAQFQLGSTPTAAITCTPTGNFPAPGSRTKVSDIISHILTEDGALSSSYIDSAFNSVAISWPYFAGIYYASTDTGDLIDAVDTLLASAAMKLFPTRAGKLRPWVLRTILETQTALAVFDKTNIIAITPRALPSTLDPPCYRFSVNYKHAYNQVVTGTTGWGSPSPDGVSVKTLTDAQSLFAKAQDHAAFGGALQSSTNTDTVASDMLNLWSVHSPFTLVTSGSVSSGSVITFTTNPQTSLISNGLIVTGTGVPANSYVVSSTTTTVTINNTITSIANATTLTFSGWARTYTRRPRRLFDVTVPVSVGLASEIGDWIQLSYPMDDLDKTLLLGQIVGDNFSSQNATITFSVLI